MDRPISITDNVYWIGMNDRETHLFESLWPLPCGVSYNSYIIADEKVALIDTVKFTVTSPYLDKIRGLLGGKGKIDYLIVNHMEPDHSGSIRAIVEAFPDIKIVGNLKTAKFLENFYGITENIYIVDDGDELDLGSRKLRFHLTPMVHWPETMMTYDTKDRILFSGDAFGGFGSLDGGIFDDELNIGFYEEEISRYYTNIVAKYSPMVQTALRKLSSLDVKIVAATHGPVWRSNPEYIINYYDRLSSMETVEGAAVIYGSMYGNTKKMAERVARILSEEGIENIRIHDASKSHLSYLINDAWRYRGLVIGTPTYNTGVFPPVNEFVNFLSRSRIKNHVIGVFGSCGWGGGGVKELESFARNSACTFVEPVVEAMGAPKEEDLQKLDEMARGIAREIKQLSCRATSL
ncbi:MAG: FprA family A-type flavoprotein [Candidatus Thermoplasmatota archaeon]|nr:FprA family A-type flavoprotein [Candidatus Thermoplasmatota archaeon]